MLASAATVAGGVESSTAQGDVLAENELDETDGIG